MTARAAATRPALGIALALGATLAFAVGPVAARVALEDGSNTLTVVALRGVVAAALLLAIIAASRGGFSVPRAARGAVVATGVFQAVAIWAFIAAVARLRVGLAVLVFFTHPLLVAAIAHLRGEDRLTPRKLLLALVVLGGLAAVVGAAAEAPDAAGILLAALASVAVTGMILFSARAGQHAGVTQVSLHATLVGTLGFLAIATVLGAWAPPAGGVGWLGIAGAGLGIGLGLLALLAAFRHIGPVRASMLGSVEPLVATLLAALVLGETLAPGQWTGVAVVVGALVLFEAADHAEAKPP